MSDNSVEVEQLQKIFGSQSAFREINLSIALSGAQAMDFIINESSIGFIIIDTDMQDLDPNALAVNLIDAGGDRPVLFFGSQQIIKDRITDSVYRQNEFNDQLLRPMDRASFLDDLCDKIGNITEWAKEEEFNQDLLDITPDDFIPMKIKGFFLHKSFQYDVYLAITPTRYIKILSANKPYTISMLTSYAKKNVRFLQIKKDDHLKYLETECQLCLKGLRDLSFKNDEVYVMYLRCISVIHQYIIAVGPTPTVHRLAEATINSIIKHHEHTYQFSAILDEYPSYFEGIASKSLLTAYFALQIAKRMGWDSEVTKGKLVLAAILQDYSLPDERMSKITNTKSQEMLKYSEEEIEAYMEHPNVAAKMAEYFTAYPDVDYLIVHHHELPNKQGFPNKPPNTKLTSLCSVFNVAQHIASVVDGEKMTNNNLLKTFNSMNKQFNQASFKEPLKLAKRYIRVSAQVKSA